MSSRILTTSDTLLVDLILGVFDFPGKPRSAFVRSTCDTPFVCLFPSVALSRPLSGTMDGIYP